MLSASQRCQRNAYEVGLPFQLPSSVVSVSPTVGVPEMIGRSVLRGTPDPPAGATTSVCADCALAVPSAFDAVTRTRIVWSRSAPTSVYVFCVPFATSTQLLPLALQRSHW